MFKLIVVLIVALAVACLGNQDEMSEAERQGLPTPARENAGTKNVDSGYASRIVVSDSYGSVTPPLAVDAFGQGSDRVGSVSVVNGVGTIVLKGEVRNALAYATTDWPEVGYTTHQLLAVTSSEWWIVWLYCRGGQLEVIYSESTHGAALTKEYASGSCAMQVNESAIGARFPAVDMTVPPLVDGFQIEGDGLRLRSGEAGTLEMSDGQARVFPFQVVDCSACPRDGLQGWYELHVVLWQPSATRASFGILYLDPRQPGVVTLHYQISLPDLSIKDSLRISAAWTRLLPSVAAFRPSRVATLWGPLGVGGFGVPAGSSR